MKAPTIKAKSISARAQCVTPKRTAGLTYFPKAWSAGLALASILAVAHAPAQGAEEMAFFREDFEDGNATDGVPARWEINRLMSGAGSGGVVDGVYVLRTTAGRQSLWTDGSEPIDDVSVRTVVRAMNDTSGTIMVIAHGQTDGKAYMGSIGDHGMALWMSRGAFPIPDMVNAKTDPKFNPFTQDMNIQFDVVGRKMTLTAWPVGASKPTKPDLTGFAATLLPPGRVGINTGIATVLVQSIDAIRIGNSLPPAPTVQIQMHPGIVVEGTVGAHHRVEWRDAQTPDSPWHILEDIPSLPTAIYTVVDPTPVSAGNQRLYQAVLVP